jgi:hypothetical protein
MSTATSQRGKEYAEGFCAGFVFQNSDLMVGGNFEAVDLEVSERKMDGTVGRTLGDIDAMFVTSRDCQLVDMLPSRVGWDRPETRTFVVHRDTTVFIELTTQSGQDLATASNYIEKKVIFYGILKSGKGYNFTWPSQHLLLFIFNGVDHAGVTAKFLPLCLGKGINGRSVYVTSSVMTSWEATQRAVIADKRAHEAEQQAREAEQQVREAEQQVREAEQRRLDVEAENARLREMLVQLGKDSTAKLDERSEIDTT